MQSRANAITSCGVGGKSGEVEAQPADQHLRFRGGLHFQSARREAPRNQRIKRRLTGSRRNFRLPRRDESPVFLILRAFPDPLLQELLLRTGQCAFALRWRHHLIRIGVQNALDELALRCVARDERLLFHRLLAHIKAEASLAMIRIRTVAEEAFVRENRTDVAIELDLREGGRAQGRGHRGKGKESG